MTRILNFLIAVDQLLNVIVCLGDAFPFETLSSHAFRMEKEGKPWGVLRPVIDGIFFWQHQHCYHSYLAVRPLLPAELQNI